MALEWSNELATGYEEIDQQHRELFNRINNLFEACKQRKGMEEVKSMMQFLADYVIKHFSAEEKYMERLSYPGYAAHKAQHWKFTETFSELKKRLEEEGPGVLLVVNTNLILVEWLKNHIRKVDKELGAFLKNNIR